MKKSLKTILVTSLILATSSTPAFAESNSTSRIIGGIGSGVGSGIMGGSTRPPITGGIGSGTIGSGTRPPITGGIGSGTIGSTVPSNASGRILVGYRSIKTQVKNVRLNKNSTINIVMPSDKTQLVQGTVSIIGNNTNKIREYSFSNYAYNTETINITDFNEPCRVTVRVEGRGTSQQNRIVTYTIN